MQRLAMLLGTIIGVVLVTLVATVRLVDSEAQADTTVTFVMTWPAQDVPEPCTRTTAPGELMDMDGGGATLFTHVITLRDASGNIAQMVPLRGEATDDDPNVCQMEISLRTGDEPGYTIWYEDRYMASVLTDEGVDPYAGIILRN